MKRSQKLYVLEQNVTGGKGVPLSEHTFSWRIDAADTSLEQEFYVLLTRQTRGRYRLTSLTQPTPI